MCNCRILIEKTKLHQGFSTVKYSIILLSTLFSLGMLTVRLAYTGSYYYTMLIWNLFLAFAPFFISSLVMKHREQKWYFYLLPGILWLLLLPNAPYIITDFVHLEDSGLIPRWFDLMLLMAFAWTGLLYWLLSMFHFNHLIGQKLNPHFRLIINQSVILLTSVGVYLGRFGRYNSWDAFIRPDEIVERVFQMLFHPMEFPGFFGMTIAMHILLTLLFGFFQNTGHMKTGQAFPANHRI